MSSFSRLVYFWHVFFFPQIEPQIRVVFFFLKEYKETDICHKRSLDIFFIHNDVQSSFVPKWIHLARINLATGSWITGMKITRNMPA